MHLVAMRCPILWLNCQWTVTFTWVKEISLSPQGWDHVLPKLIKYSHCMARICISQWNIKYPSTHSSHKASRAIDELKIQKQSASEILSMWQGLDPRVSHAQNFEEKRKWVYEYPTWIQVAVCFSLSKRKIILQQYIHIARPKVYFSQS